MKKLISPLFIVLSLLAVPTAFGYAQAAPAVINANTHAKPVVSAAAPDETLLPLGTRRDNVVLQLTDINTRLTTFTARTQLALDRLAQKNIGTGKAQAELTIATNDLASAKLALDALAKIEIPEENQEKVTLEIKASVQKIQDQLKDARAHLITTLSILKTTLTATVDSIDNPLQ